MLHETELDQLRPGLTPFPQNIFTDEQAWLYQHLLPLLSIDLGILRSELAGTVVHMLCPIEPYEGYIGDGTEASHNEFCGTNWFALQLTADNRYHFLGQPSYFRAPVDKYEHKHADEMKQSHREAIAYFEKSGRLGREVGGEVQAGHWLDNLGGEIWYGNWTGHPDAPSAFKLECDSSGEVIELSYQGKPFFLVADVAGYNYLEHGADAILLFYEPQSRIVLFSFDWT